MLSILRHNPLNPHRRHPSTSSLLGLSIIKPYALGENQIETGNMTISYFRDGDMDFSVTPTKNYPNRGISLYLEF